MLIKLNKTDKKGRQIYLNKETGKEQTLPYFPDKIKNKMPDNAFNIRFSNRKNKADAFGFMK